MDPSPDRPTDLEARLAHISEALRQIEQRVTALERRAAGARSAARRGAAAIEAAEREAIAGAGADMVAGLSLGGRTLLVLAGAFVLRALTDAGTLPAWLGVCLGFTYAGIWVAMADRAGGAGRQASAGFHGLAAVAIGFPLLFEAASRFKLLSPALAAATLAAFTAGGLGVAARRRLQPLAWLVALGGIAAAISLMVVAGRMAPAALYLVLLGVATLWLGYVLDWMALRWPIALAADLAVALMAVRAVSAGAIEGPSTALLVQFVLMALYLGSIAARTLLLQRRVVVFEVVQTAAAILVGLGGASFVALRSGMGAGGFGGAAVALGLASYAVAYAFVERRQKGRANFYFYTSVALAFLLAGTALVLSGRVLPVAWAGLALVASGLAFRQRRATLAAHAAVYAVAAAAASGLFAHALETTLASAAVPWTPALPESLAVLTAMAAGSWLTAGASIRSTAVERVPQLAFLAALAVAAAGVLIGWLVPLFAGTPGLGANAGVVATVRTAVLSCGALLLAWAGRFEPWREAGWLAYPLLLVIGLKILVEDLSAGRPATLFLGFAFYGAALILVPRLRHRRARPASPAPQGRGAPHGPTGA